MSETSSRAASENCADIRFTNSFGSVSPLRLIGALEPHVRGGRDGDEDVEPLAPARLDEERRLDDAERLALPSSSSNHAACSSRTSGWMSAVQPRERILVVEDVRGELAGGRRSRPRRGTPARTRRRSRGRRPRRARRGRGRCGPRRARGSRARSRPSAIVLLPDARPPVRPTLRIIRAAPRRDASVFFRSMAIVSGPTPPGTGV